LLLPLLDGAAVGGAESAMFMFSLASSALRRSYSPAPGSNVHPGLAEASLDDTGIRKE
jgi:hypothetical protein